MGQLPVFLEETLFNFEQFPQRVQSTLRYGGGMDEFMEVVPSFLEQNISRADMGAGSPQ